MENKTFSFAGITVCLRSENPIGDSAYFSEFRSESEKIDIAVNVELGDLPQKDGRIIRGGNNSSLLISDDKKYLFSSYYDPVSKGMRDYACLSEEDGQMRLTVCGFDRLWDSMLFDALNVSGLLLRNGAAVLHSSFIIHNGRAVLFTGRSQIGKTTQAKLWEKHRGAKIINGDRAALKIENGRLVACGIPFCGSSDIALNASAPIEAVVSLGQSEKNTVVPVPSGECFKILLNGLSFEPRFEEESGLAVDFAAAACEKVRMLGMSCRPDESAVSALEEALWII